MKQGLIIVDVQNDYFENGTMKLVGMNEAALNCKHLLSHFRSNEMPVFHVQHLATREGATFFVPNTYGCEINELVTPQSGEHVIVKNFPSSFRGTQLHDLLQAARVEEVIICGAMTHMCIDTTTRAAFDLGYKCRVISDACATKDLEFAGRVVRAVDVQTTFMAALSMPFAEVITTQEFLSR